MYFIATLIIFNTLGAIGLEDGNRNDLNCGMVKGNETLTNGRFNLDFLGYDYDGLPVVIGYLGRYDGRWLVERPWEKEIYRRNYEQYIEEVRNDGVFFNRFVNRSEPFDYHVSIFDFDGFDLRQIFSDKVVKFLLSIFQINQRVLGSLSYGFILNANPVADQVLNMIKPLTANLLEKYEVYGTNKKNWIPQVLKKIPRDQLPLKYGGVEGFKPIATCDLV